MNSEAVFYYILHTIFGIGGSIQAYLVLKYLNQKALGMQTLFDQMIKDQIYISIINSVVRIVLIIVIEFMSPINQTIALLINFLKFMLMSAKIWQFSMILLIRHFSVFYQNLMNSVDEYLVKRIGKK